jgi:hypothetical protein
MTSNRGAGFSSNPRGRFDPLSQGKSALGTGSGTSLLPKKQEPSAEEVRWEQWIICSSGMSSGSSTEPQLERADAGMPQPCFSS